MGFTFEQAVELTARECRIYDLGLADEAESIPISDHSGYYNRWSPFVATTASLPLALRFATEFGRSRGYVTMLSVSAERCIEVARYADHAIARREREFAVRGRVVSEEIVGQAPADALLRLLPPEKWSNAEFIADAEGALAGAFEPFHHDPGVPAQCMVCETHLSPYLTSHIADIAPLTPMRAAPVEPKGSSPVLSAHIDLRTMAEVGLAIRCPTCGEYLVSVHESLAAPIATRILEQTGSECAFEVENVSRRYIRNIVVQTTYVSASESRVQEYGLSPPPAFIMDPGSWAYLAPGERRVELLDIDDPEVTVSDVRPFAVCYENGLGWFCLEDVQMRSRLAGAIPEASPLRTPPRTK